MCSQEGELVSLRGVREALREKAPELGLVGGVGSTSTDMSGCTGKGGLLGGHWRLWKASREFNL